MIAQTPSARRRQELGQVRTPQSIAKWMTSWACAGRPNRILEPCVGDGVFVESIAELAGGTFWRPGIESFDVDALQIAALSRAEFLRRDGISLNCRNEDFLTASMNDRYECIIANPPYVRHHAMQYSDEVWRRFDQQCGGRLSRMTNLYGLFMLRIWSLLAPRGRAALITPAEWLNADFGKQLKRYLLNENAIEAIVHFHPRSRVFSDALTTAVIILMRQGRAAGDPVQLTSLEDASELDVNTLKSGRLISRTALDPTLKWTNLFYGSTSGPDGSGRTLAAIADCRRGIATGANQFFTLRESERLKWGLPEQDMAVCITKAGQLTTDKLTAGVVREWIDQDERVFLFRPRELSDPVQRYLDHGHELGIDSRYLPSHRPVWYMPEERPPAPILISVFSRTDFRVVLNEARALNLTAYHGIYPRDNSAATVQLLFDYLRSFRGRMAISHQRRIYGGGLFKLEPRDVEAVEIPETLV
jgi:adenine-specific DNA-methyltransferase